MDINTSFLTGGLALDIKAQVPDFSFPLLDFVTHDSLGTTFAPSDMSQSFLPTVQPADPVTAFFESVMQPLAESPQSIDGLSYQGSPLMSPLSFSTESLSPIISSCTMDSLLCSPMTTQSSPVLSTKRPFKDVNGCDASEQNKKKKKRKPKPRMADLPLTEAQIKRDSNRESARKCRERKRDREQSALSENEHLRQQVADLRIKVSVLTSLLLEKERITCQTSQSLLM